MHTPSEFLSVYRLCGSRINLIKSTQNFGIPVCGRISIGGTVEAFYQVMCQSGPFSHRQTQKFCSKRT
jgi:hypothetical protein